MWSQLYPLFGENFKIPSPKPVNKQGEANQSERYPFHMAKKSTTQIQHNFLALICQHHESLNKLFLNHEQYRSCKNTLHYLCAHSLIKTRQSFIADHFKYCIKSTCIYSIEMGKTYFGKKEDKNIIIFYSVLMFLDSKAKA